MKKMENIKKVRTQLRMILLASPTARALTESKMRNAFQFRNKDLASSHIIRKYSGYVACFY